MIDIQPATDEQIVKWERLANNAPVPDDTWGVVETALYFCGTVYIPALIARIRQVESRRDASPEPKDDLCAELVKWAAGDGWLSAGDNDFCIFCEQSATLVDNPDGSGWDIEHLPACLHLRAVAALSAAGKGEAR